MSDANNTDIIIYNNGKYCLVGRVEGKIYWPLYMIANGKKYVYNRTTKVYNQEQPHDPTPSD